MKSKEELKQLYEKGLKMHVFQKQSLNEIHKKLGIDKGSLSNYIKKQGYEVINYHNTSNSINSNIFNKIDTEEKAYWLGFIYADGSLESPKENKKLRYNIELTLKESDYEHLEKFKKFLNSNNKISYRKNTKSYRIIITNKQIYNDLCRLGCVSRKTYNIVFPNENQVPKIFIKDFVRGFFDGDGYLGIAKDYRKSTNDYSIKPRFGFTCADKQFIYDIVKNMDWIPHKLNRKKDSIAFSMNFDGRINFFMLEEMYENAKIYLNRKYELYEKLKTCRIK